MAESAIARQVREACGNTIEDLRRYAPAPRPAEAANRCSAAGSRSPFWAGCPGCDAPVLVADPNFSPKLCAGCRP